MIIPDTNVLSEVLRPKPSPRVMEWLRAQPAMALFTTAITEAEIHFGIELMPDGKRRTSLQKVVAKILEADMSGRVLPFDSAAARAFAVLAAARGRNGAPMPQADAQIAAIARSRGAALATRNTADFGVRDRTHRSVAVNTVTTPFSKTEQRTSGPRRTGFASGGQCGLLRLHCDGLSPPAPYRSPGAFSLSKHE